MVEGLRRLAVTLIGWVALLLLTACSNGAISNTDNSAINTAAELILIAPKQMTTGANEGNIIVQNPTNDSITGIKYILANQFGSGEQISLNESSVKQCLTVMAHGQCILKVKVPDEPVAGSFSIYAINGNTSALSVTQRSLPNLTQPVVGVVSPQYDNLTGADGISLSYYHTVISGVPYILINGLVASSHVGDFNKVVLVDSNNKPIQNQELIGDTINNMPGTTFSILLPVLSGAGLTQTIKVQTQQIAGDGTVKVISTATVGSTLTTTTNQAIVEILPAFIQLTKQNPEQEITLINIGDRVAQLQNLTSLSSNIEIMSNFSKPNLETGTTMTVKLKLKDVNQPAAINNVILDYYDGHNNTTAAILVEQNSDSTPNPAPTPMAGLLATFNPDNIFFTTTAQGAASRQLTLTNTGNTTENNIVLTMPSNFTASAGSGNCIVTQQNGQVYIANSLAPNGGNCSLTITYNSTDYTPQGIDEINIAYKYGNTRISSTKLAVLYKVTQSTANLSVTPSSYIFPDTILTNNITTDVGSFSLVNNGEVAATMIVPGVAGNDSNLFSVYNNGLINVCGSELAAGASCNLGVRLGPVSEGMGIGSKSANLTINYLPYVEAISGNTILAELTGQVAAADSAIFNSPAQALNEFGSGDGTSVNPYLILQNKSGVYITFTLTNSGMVSATEFYLDTPLAGNWTFNNNCGTVNNKITLATGDSCTLTATLDTTTAQTINATSVILNASWKDQKSPGGNSQSIQFTLPAVSVISPVAITIESLGNWTTVMGNAFAFKATVSGGSSTVTPTISGINGSIVSPPSCALDSNSNSSCIFTVTPYTSNGSYASWDPALLQLRTYIFSLSVNASGFGATVNGIAAPYIFTNINGTVTAPSVFLPQTGQTTIQPVNPATPGSDGTTHAGINWALNDSTISGSRFVKSSDNCEITDRLTGLVWLNNPNQVATAKWESAVNIASAGNWCGHSDWRLANRNELLSLINYGMANSANWLMYGTGTSVNPQCDGDCFSGVWTVYWTSSIYANDPNSYAWVIRTDIGRISILRVESSTRVWPVRLGGQSGLLQVAKTGQSTNVPTDCDLNVDPAKCRFSPANSDGALMKGVSWPSPRFTGQGDCLIDKLTGLMWPKNGIIGFSQAGLFLNQPLYSNNTPSLNKLTWSNSLTAISKLNAASIKLCGYSDWRLPNVIELNSLVNVGAASPAQWLNSQGFTNIQEVDGTTALYYFSSSFSPGYGESQVAGFAMIDGTLGNLGKATANYVLPVRGGIAP